MHLSSVGKSIAVNAAYSAAPSDMVPSSVATTTERRCCRCYCVNNGNQTWFRSVDSCTSVTLTYVDDISAAVLHMQGSSICMQGSSICMSKVQLYELHTQPSGSSVSANFCKFSVYCILLHTMKPRERHCKSHEVRLLRQS